MQKNASALNKSPVIKHRASLACLAFALMLITACGSHSEQTSNTQHWQHLASSYPSLAGSNSLIVSHMESGEKTQGALHQTAYGRTALRKADRKIAATSINALLDTIDSESRATPLLTAFKFCTAVDSGKISSREADRLANKLGTNISASAERVINSHDISNFGYAASVLNCTDTAKLHAHSSTLQKMVATEKEFPYQRYLAFAALRTNDLAEADILGTPQQLPEIVNCDDPTAASDWMAIHSLNRIVAKDFYHPEVLVDCVVNHVPPINVQSAAAALIVADRSPASLQKLSSAIIDPLEQQVTKKDSSFRHRREACNGHGITLGH